MIHSWRRVDTVDASQLQLFLIWAISPQWGNKILYCTETVVFQKWASFFISCVGLSCIYCRLVVTCTVNGNIIPSKCTDFYYEVSFTWNILATSLQDWDTQQFWQLIWKCTWESAEELCYKMYILWDHFSSSKKGSKPPHAKTAFPLCWVK